MKKFREFVELKENEQMPQMDMSHEEPSPEAAAELEGLTNDIQRQVSKLFQVLSRHNLNKQKTAMLLTSLIQNLAGDTLTKQNVLQAGNNAMSQ